MANTFTTSPVPIGSQMPILRQIGAVPFQLVTTNTYATATGGIAVTTTDLNTLLQAYGIEMQVKPSDIIAVFADANAAGAGYHSVWVKQSDFSYKVRLFNGIAEIADGAVNVTVVGLMFFTPGSPV